MNAESWTLVDGHVHVHPQFNASQLLDAAASNLRLVADRLRNCKTWVGVLLLAETQGVDWFEAVRGRTSTGDAQVGSWSLRPTNEHETLIARGVRSLHPASEHQTLSVRSGGTHQTLFIISGRQIVTSEHIEVLALTTRGQFADGLSLKETIDACHAAGALVVLPWGVGKWFGERGRLVRSALGRHNRLKPVLAGDNGGRPWFWPRPKTFAVAESSGTAVLPGTDPLPLSDQATRVGSFGLALAGSIPLEFPAAALRSRLIEVSSPASAWPFGTPERISRFVSNQVRLRIHSEVA